MNNFKSENFANRNLDLTAQAQIFSNKLNSINSAMKKSRRNLESQ